MDFWNWTYVKGAEAEYKCECCKKIMQIGESHYRFTDGCEEERFMRKLCEGCGYSTLLTAMTM